MLNKKWKNSLPKSNKLGNYKHKLTDWKRSTKIK